MDSDNPEDLWRYFKRYEALTGGQVLAIPHNSNTSNGGMSALSDFNDRALGCGIVRWTHHTF